MHMEHLNPIPPLSPSYTQMVKVSGGTLLFLSGQVAVDDHGRLVGEGDLQAQARQVFENIKTHLASQEADFSNIIKITVFIVNYRVEYRQGLREVLNEYIDPERPPASTLLGIQSLARPEYLIEVEATADVN
jgi:enamine deaminase RidA (YjgF/YER057c/UK114 family)